ncbi:hypothetical protein DEM27_02225 [Metarhizobium album]|uniref:Uncharacterized protein n=1 Tax=Metarhizobium album TaxID=2182425 RepID=A0A2U2DXI6_9HYPH|nr:hypothetical protein DEM27_02225 [Rhizobium album]
MGRLLQIPKEGAAVKIALKTIAIPNISAMQIDAARTRRAGASPPPPGVVKEQEFFPAPAFAGQAWPADCRDG